MKKEVNFAQAVADIGDAATRELGEPIRTADRLSRRERSRRVSHRANMLGRSALAIAAVGLAIKAAPAVEQGIVDGTQAVATLVAEPFQAEFHNNEAAFHAQAAAADKALREHPLVTTDPSQQDSLAVAVHNSGQ